MTVCPQGYKQSKRFIIAQAPMKSTVCDFWRMVYERECSVIVMLSDLIKDQKVQVIIYFMIMSLFFSSLYCRCASHTGQKWTKRMLRNMDSMPFPLLKLSNIMDTPSGCSTSLTNR